jgi:ABC-type Fe3+-hydroxamate transport system substrate-binding protein
MYIIDQIGNQIIFDNQPKRVVSLVPSITELFCFLGANKYLIARTKFCIHPMPFINSIQRIGGTKNIRIPDILKLKPDLVLCNKEENEKTQVKTLQENGSKCYVSDIKTINNFRHFTNDLAQIMGLQNQTEQFLHELTKAYYEFPLPKLGSCLYLIWRKPFMAAGGDTFINELLTLAGFDNILVDRKRYPELSLQEIYELKPAYILLSSEPYPFKQKHVEELKQILPESNILLVDGEMFSWYGNRLLEASFYFKQLHMEQN